MKVVVQAGEPLKGVYRPAGDKSLSHRAALFAALAKGESRIEHFLVSGVTRAMLDALTALKITWSLSDERVLTVEGKGLKGFTSPGMETPVDCGNSATTFRLLAGALAGAGTACVLDGSEGLRKRPMARITEPLQEMGVDLILSSYGGAPLILKERPLTQALKGIHHVLPVASAQVKSCLILAALSGDSETVLEEPGPSRDHTERMLRAMGAAVDVSGSKVTVYPLERPLKPLNTALAGDISSAAFLMVAAAIVPGSKVRIEKVGLNPTRTGIIDALRLMGASITITDETEMAGEPVGDILVEGSGLKGVTLEGDLVVRMIDEFPAFAVAAALARGETVVKDAEELRYKESDRISMVCGELRKLGVMVMELPDGFRITGGKIGKGTVDSHGDHRLAMSLIVAGLRAEEGSVVVDGAEVMAESFPDFTACLRQFGARVCVIED